MELEFFKGLFIAFCNDDRQEKRENNKYLNTFKTKTAFDMKLKTFAIPLKGLSYCKTKRHIADMTFKQLHETKPCFKDQSIFEYIHHLCRCCDLNW